MLGAGGVAAFVNRHLQRGFTDLRSYGPPRMASYNEESPYTAVSDIIMHNGVRPPAASAFDARTVQANLAARERRPSKVHRPS